MIRLNSYDYRQLISNRCDNVRTTIWESFNRPGGFNAPMAAGEMVDPETVPPNFNEIRDMLSEIQQLVEEFELSLSPA
jgi:hypothetical protein